MDHYYTIIHPQCTILPDKAKTLAVLEKASHEYTLVFCTAMNLLPHKGKDDSGSLTKSKEELETFVEAKARLKWVERSNLDNLVLLWSILLLHITYLHDIQAYAKQDALINIGLDLVAGFVKIKDFIQDLQHEYEWIRTFNIAAMLARLHAVSQGNSTDPLPSYLTSYLNTDWQVIALRPRLVVMMTDVLQAALSILPKDGVTFSLESSEGFARLQSSNIRAWLSASAISPEEPFVKEIEAFIALLSLRFITPGPGPAILGAVCSVVEAIRVSSLQQDDEQYLFNPLSFHTVSMATTALLEIQSCSLDQQQGRPMVEAAINDMVKQLTGLVKRRARLTGGAGGLFWAEALIELVEEKTKTLRTVPGPEDKREDDVVPELARILHQGYLHPLLDMIFR